MLHSRDDAPSTVAFVPRLPPFVVPRARLLDRLDEIAQHALAIVRAPGGYGKTVLLSAWSRHQSTPGFWMTLDPSSGSRPSFWRRLIETACDAGLVPPGSLLRDVIVDATTLRSTLLRGFHSLERSILIVLDDYHHVSDPLVHDDLVWLLSNGAPLRVVVGTRTRSPLEDAGTAVRLGADILPSDELLLTEDETGLVSASAEAGMGVALHRAFHGWPIATQAALVELRSGRAPSLDEAIQRVNLLGLIPELAQIPDSPYLTFLMRTSVATRLTPGLALELGGDAAARHLAQAEEEGLGTWAPAGPEQTFSYHPLLKSILEAELVRREPDSVSRLRSVAARAADRSGDPLAAMRLYAAADNWEGVLAVVQRHYATIQQFHNPEAHELLDAAPESSLRRHPPLLVFSLLHSYAQPHRSSRGGLLRMASLGVALARAHLGRGEADERSVLLLALMGSQRMGGDYERASATAERLAEVLRLLTAEERERIAGVLPTAWSQAALSRFYIGDFAGAADLLRDASSASAEGSWQEVHAASMMLLISAVRGDMASLNERLAQVASRTRPHGWRGEYPSAGYHLASAASALESFDAGKARAELSMLAKHEETIEHWPMIARTRALAALIDHGPRTALRGLEQDVASHAGRPPTSPLMHSLLALTRADLLLASGMPHRARSALAALRRSDASLAVANARVAFALGRPGRAITLAEPHAWSVDPVPRVQAEALLTLGIAAQRTGQTADAREAAGHAREVLVRYRLRLMLALFPRAELTMLLELVGAEGLLADVPDLHVRNPVPPALSESERRVLTALEQSDRIADAAEALFLSTNTVKVHARRIYRKLNASSREEAIAVARLHGLLEDHDT